ncbi:MAG: immune inhibitor A [Ruminococcus sp.]|nr:immune inhibitor A [Ruminococcus sp.]
MKKITLLKKITASVILLMFSLSVSAEPYALAETSEVQLNNIVLFAQSDSLASSNFMENRVEDIISMCNDADTCHSLAGYIDRISYGKMRVTSYFPQMKDGVITPYILSADTDTYLTCSQIAVEILQNIDIPNDTPMDADSDGIIDNIILVVDGKAVDMSSPIWARAFSVNGIKINGLSVNRVNIHNSTQLFENQITGAEGVLCHEFLHSLGYPDLYRNNRTGTPVGLWDIMASDSVFVQYPLAYHRAKISGWLESADITTSGTYTLSPVSSDSGNRLYLLKTSLSDTEFFAVEYRQQGKRYSDEMDVKIYGTGLVVYRVNTEADGNFKGTKDEIYVFRPEETALDAGEGNLFSSNYGGENAPDSVGSLNMNDDITDGALVYSNGTNSGIRISNITMNDESLTFSVEFADISDIKLWESISSDNLGSYKPCQLASSENGTIYLIASNESTAMLYKYDGNEFTNLGKPLGSGSYADMNQPELAFCGDVPYVLYRDRNFFLHLCRYERSSETWTEIYKGTELAQYANMTADGNKVYFTYTTGTFPYALHCACYNSETEVLTTLDENIAKNVCNMSVAVLNNNPVIAYRDINDGNKSKLAVYNNGEWNIKIISETACGSVSMVSDGNTAWIAPSGSGNAVYQFSGEKITSYPLPNNISENAFMQTPILADGKCCLAVNTQNPYELALYSLNGTEWEMTGNILAMDLVNSLSLAYNEQKLYCSYFTNNGTSVIKQLNIGKSKILTGDINDDGVFNIADAVTLQKWLLAVPDTMPVNWKAGDIYEDNRLDVFDFCLMKRMLIEQ